MVRNDFRVESFTYDFLFAMKDHVQKGEKQEINSISDTTSDIGNAVSILGLRGLRQCCVQESPIRTTIKPSNGKIEVHALVNEVVVVVVSRSVF